MQPKSPPPSESDAARPEWGKYTFGSDRVDTPYEEDTPGEKFALKNIKSHFQGVNKLSITVADKIRDLVLSKQYTKLLEFPTKKYPTVYRGMGLEEKEILKYISKDKFDERQIKKNWVTFDVTGIARPRGDTASWSVEFSVATRFANRSAIDLERSTAKIDIYEVVLHANTSDNPDAFIINPDAIYNVNVLSEFEDELETIAIGPIKFNKISVRIPT